MAMSDKDWRDWDYQQRPVLWQIEDLSKRIQALVAALPSRPKFVTKAETELSEAVRALREAERSYQSKLVD